MKDTSYRELPLGAEAAAYLLVKSKRLTPEACLDKLARYFPELELVDFEPPAGGRRRAPRTYNKNLSVVHDFFEWELRRGALRGDPTVTIERAKPRSIHRTA